MEALVSTADATILVCFAGVVAGGKRQVLGMGASDKDVMTAISVENDGDEDVQQEKSEAGYLGDISDISQGSETWKNSSWTVHF